jgi:hypothetical protein
VLVSFVPEGEFDPIPESELVIDDAKIVFDDMLGGSDGICNFAVLESLSDEFDDSLLPLAGCTICVTPVSKHSCLRYNKVASFTRLIPPLIPKRRKRRLKCAFTVRRAILSWLAISALSQP